MPILWLKVCEGTVLTVLKLILSNAYHRRERWHVLKTAKSGFIHVFISSSTFLAVKVREISALQYNKVHRNVEYKRTTSDLVTYPIEFQPIYYVITTIPHEIILTSRLLASREFTFCALPTLMATQSEIDSKKNCKGFGFYSFTFFNKCSRLF